MRPRLFCFLNPSILNPTFALQAVFAFAALRTVSQGTPEHFQNAYFQYYGAFADRKIVSMCHFEMKGQLQSLCTFILLYFYYTQDNQLFELFAGMRM
jgi:hypothetical protein